MKITANFIYLKQLKFEHRKVVHYTLLSSIILLQVIAIVTWYNETKLSEAFENMASAGRMSRLNSSLVKSQGYFNTYITNKDATSLKNYAANLNEVSALISSLRLENDDNKNTTALLKKKTKTQADILRVKSAIDSVIEKQSSQYKNDFPKAFKFEAFGTKKFLDDVKTDSYVKVDSASQKGLFSRLGDAIANRVNVQKEYVNTVVTMQYKDKVTTGDIEEQMANVVTITNKYYANEFAKLKESFANLRKNDVKLMELNNQLLALTQTMNDYSNGTHLLQPDAQQLEDQYKSNKAVRSYSIVLLILLMLVVSVILFNFTHVAFEYENRLTLATAKIRQSLQFKNRITGMISHEIRSPLSIIGMYSKKASASSKDAALKETFKSIEFTTNSLLLLSNQILEYSKEENHEPSLKCRNINLKDEIYQIVHSMTSLAEVKGNTLKLVSNIKEDTVVYSDAAKIHQLFYNLIGNANKFTENGRINVSTMLKELSEYEMNLAVVISDNGIGIATDDLQNIFESYYQGTVSEKVNDLGVGLGLNICKEIIELFDGKITVESNTGKGTKVTFNLILTQAE
ncbi:HAMP domain-containing sensor histidine kinase [Flavobacterium paronense]|uniref:histidine kinase n=1 Tax=Flavobacterium paronense TaxID=1392775 RepID=A0ABV5GBI5_9FLAO|nr:HAMP domain-containing sensor histidine kinase [Flavobacterium paronense]MDN3677691.1 HAMP domain-containing sensor histidine kinase [Flavobacterium paronense]